ncbi:MAG: mevalonate kinase [Chloroflexi bacterium]|nr:mevalonate kinase [Chloroflexota bacterium]
MTVIVTSSPAKIILCGDHGVNRQQPALATAVDVRTFCRVTRRPDQVYTFRSDERYEECTRERLLALKAEVDALRQAQALDEIRERAREFFAPTRYVLAHVVEQAGGPGLDIEWRSSVPISSGLGSGAAASTSMALAAFQMAGHQPAADEVIYVAWQGDIIAHGGVASSLDSSAIVLGGLIRYTISNGAERLPITANLPLVIGNTFVRDRSTAKLNTHVRKWLEAHPAKMHLFRDMGYLVRQIIVALENNDLVTLGHLLNLHHLIQDKIGTSVLENEQLIEAAIEAGALGAKISGAGGGGIIIALTEPDKQAAVAAAIDAAGGRSLITSTGTPGARVESEETWDTYPNS